MKRNAPIKLGLPTVEWDFRSVNEDQLEWAIQWEYARENERVRASTCEWLAVALKDGLTVRPSLIPETKEEMVIARTGQLLGRLGGKLRTVILKGNTDFPNPWLSRVRNATTWIGPPLLEIEFRPLVLRSRGPWPGFYAFQIQIGARAEDIVKEFSKWLSDRTKELRAGAKSRRGTRAKPPWHILKELAAYRINKEMSFKEAVGSSDNPGFLRTYRDKNPVDGAPDVLPIYDNKASWSKAVSKARMRLKKVA